MMKRVGQLLLGTGMTVMSQARFTAMPSAHAQTSQCIYLREVTTGKVSIEKRAAIEGLGDNNWNTDFAVPGGI